MNYNYFLLIETYWSELKMLCYMQLFFFLINFDHLYNTTCTTKRMQVVGGADGVATATIPANTNATVDMCT